MSNEIAPSMTALFNKSLSLGKVPQEWKEANSVIPIPKKGNIHEVVNYRPISLLSLVSKLLEQVVNIHVDLSRLFNLAE
jgi:sarcosine oxidase/L-pipecolate oxidase